MSAPANTFGKTRIEITDRNGVRTHRWVNNQQLHTEASTGKNGMLKTQPQFTRDANGNVSTVTENGVVVARYAPALPGLKDVEHAERMVEIYLAKQKVWAKVQSDHDRAFKNSTTGMSEYWLYGVRLPDRATWEAAKRMPLHAFLSAYPRTITTHPTPIKRGYIPAEKPTADGREQHHGGIRARIREWLDDVE